MVDLDRVGPVDWSKRMLDGPLGVLYAPTAHSTSMQSPAVEANRYPPHVSMSQQQTPQPQPGQQYQPAPVHDGRQSRSTDAMDSPDATSNDGSQVSQNQQQQQQQQNQAAMHLGAALQNATGIEHNNTFPNFNNAGQGFQDIFGFQNNSLLQYPMLSQFRNNGQGFDTKPDLQTIQSQMQMREAKPYKCTQCIKSFANSSYLSQHMRIHLGIKPFGPCQYCGKKFTQLSHLQQHIRTHTGEKPYKCKYAGCEKAFSQLSNLQSHSRCHQSDKPFKCNSCYKCFSDEQSLLEHIPKHKESKHLKVHICPFCGKSYTQATYLQKHMTKHADRTRGTIRPDFVGDAGLDLNNWNTHLPAMPEDQHANQLAFMSGQFATTAANNMMSQAAAAAPYNQALNNSAFTQLLNFNRSNGGSDFKYFDSTYQNLKPTGGMERPAGFNMITPLENIQRYTSQQGSSSHPPPVSAPQAPPPQPTSQQFPSNIINNMKPAY